MGAARVQVSGWFLQHASFTPLHTAMEYYGTITVAQIVWPNVGLYKNKCKYNSRKRKLVRLVLRSRVVKIVWEGNLVFQQRLKRFSHCICNARLAMFYVTTCTLVYKYTGMTLGGRKDGLVTVPWKSSSEPSQSIMLWICFYHLIIIKRILIVWKLGKKKVCGMFFQCYTEPLFNRHTQGSFILEEYTCL